MCHTSTAAIHSLGVDHGEQHCRPKLAEYQSLQRPQRERLPYSCLDHLSAWLPSWLVAGKLEISALLLLRFNVCSRARPQTCAQTVVASLLSVTPSTTHCTGKQALRCSLPAWNQHGTVHRCWPYSSLVQAREERRLAHWACWGRNVGRTTWLHCGNAPTGYHSDCMVSMNSMAIGCPKFCYSTHVHLADLLRANLSAFNLSACCCC